MWIKELPKDFLNKTSYYNNVVFLWKSDDLPIYVSDNHLTAAWCWMQECEKGKEYNFMHIDCHPDLKACGYPEILDFLKNNSKISFEEYRELTYNNGQEYQFFQWDNYIRACHYVFPEWFNANYFYVHNPILSNVLSWGYKPFPYEKRDSKLLNEDISNFIEKRKYIDDVIDTKIKKGPWIVNLDLDFFWDENKTKIYDTQSISDIANSLKKAMGNIKVLTIALSPDCISGIRLEDKWRNVIEVLNIFNEELGLSISLDNN